jgi:aminobenzoyl-glutamate transport protein
MAEIKAAAPPTPMQRMLDVVERVGNKAPHPAIIFVILIGVVSHLFYMLGLSVSYRQGVLLQGACRHARYRKACHRSFDPYFGAYQAKET